MAIWTTVRSLFSPPVNNSSTQSSANQYPSEFQSAYRDDRGGYKKTEDDKREKAQIAVLMKRIKQDIHSVEHIMLRITHKQRIRKSRMRRQQRQIVNFPAQPMTNLRRLMQGTTQTYRRITDSRVDPHSCNRVESLSCAQRRLLPSCDRISMPRSEILGKRKRSTDLDGIEKRKHKIRRVENVNNFWNTVRLNKVCRPSGYEFPFSPIFWGTRVIDAEEFTHLINSGYGTKFLNQKPAEVRRAPFMPSFSSGVVVGPVLFSRWIEIGFGARTIAQILD